MKEPRSTSLDLYFVSCENVNILKRGGINLVVHYRCGREEKPGGKYVSSRETEIERKHNNNTRLKERRGKHEESRINKIPQSGVKGQSAK